MFFFFGGNPTTTKNKATRLLQIQKLNKVLIFQQKQEPFCHYYTKYIVHIYNILRKYIILRSELKLPKLFNIQYDKKNYDNQHLTKFFPKYYNNTNQ